MSLGDNQLWLKSMEECFLSDEETSLKLMDYYFENDKNKFENNAHKLYGCFRNTAEYLIDKIQTGTDFYIKLLKDLAETDKGLKYFIILRTYLNPDGIIEFVDGIKSANTKAIMLAQEERYDELVQLIDKEYIKNDSYFNNSNLIAALDLISGVRAENAWLLINKKIKQLMSGSKGRDTYSFIAQLLKSAKKFKGKEVDVEMLIKELFNHKPNLPALKEIFRAEGLV